MQGSDEIKASLSKWKQACDKAMKEPDPDHPDKFRPNQFVGPQFGRLWTAVKIAIIDSGRFANSNDQAVIDEIELKRERQRVKQAKKMRSRRRTERLEHQAQRKLPPQQYQKAAWDECELRAGQLMTARNHASVPRSIKRLSNFGCEMTAYAWYYRTLVEFQGEPVRAGTMARWMVDEAYLSQGRSYETLKDRLREDIKRAAKIEAGAYGVIWNDFDPDEDLDL